MQKLQRHFGISDMRGSILIKGDENWHIIYSDGSLKLGFWDVSKYKKSMQVEKGPATAARPTLKNNQKWQKMKRKSLV